MYTNISSYNNDNHSVKTVIPLASDFAEWMHTLGLG